MQDLMVVSNLHAYDPCHADDDKVYMTYVEDKRAYGFAISGSSAVQLARELNAIMALRFKASISKATNSEADSYDDDIA